MTKLLPIIKIGASDEAPAVWDSPAASLVFRAGFPSRVHSAPFPFLTSSVQGNTLSWAAVSF